MHRRIDTARDRRRGKRPEAPQMAGVLIVSTKTGVAVTIDDTHLDLDFDNTLRLAASLFAGAVPAAIAQGVSPDELDYRFAALVREAADSGIHAAEQVPS